MTTPKCGIQWIDQNGNPTPDSNPAEWIAFCKTPDVSKPYHFLLPRAFQKGDRLFKLGVYSTSKIC